MRTFGPYFLFLFTVAAAIAPNEKVTIFGEGVISTPDYELNAAFTPDGRSVYFTKATANMRFWTIVVSHLREGRWSEPEVASFSGEFSDADPFVSPDGQKLFFISRRPRTQNGPIPREPDLWYVEKTPNGWSEAKNVGAPVNTEAGEYYPTVAANGNLYFATIRPEGKGRNDIYCARWKNGKYLEPENLGEPLNTAMNEGDTSVAADESFLVINITGRPDDMGMGDLYISDRQADGRWGAPRHLGPEVNSIALEFCPILSPDAKTLYFTSTRGFGFTTPERKLTTSELAGHLRGIHNGLGNIYRIDVAALRR